MTTALDGVASALLQSKISTFFRSFKSFGEHVEQASREMRASVELPPLSAKEGGYSSALLNELREDVSELRWEVEEMKERALNSLTFSEILEQCYALYYQNEEERGQLEARLQEHDPHYQPWSSSASAFSASTFDGAQPDDDFDLEPPSQPRLSIAPGGGGGADVAAPRAHHSPAAPYSAYPPPTVSSSSSASSYPTSSTSFSTSSSAAGGLEGLGLSASALAVIARMEEQAAASKASSQLPSSSVLAPSLSTATASTAQTSGPSQQQSQLTPPTAALRKSNEKEECTASLAPARASATPLSYQKTEDEVKEDEEEEEELHLGKADQKPNHVLQGREERAKKEITMETNAPAAVSSSSSYLSLLQSYSSSKSTSSLSNSLPQDTSINKPQFNSISSSTLTLSSSSSSFPSIPTSSSSSSLSSSSAASVASLTSSVSSSLSLCTQPSLSASTSSLSLTPPSSTCSSLTSSSLSSSSSLPTWTNFSSTTANILASLPSYKSSVGSSSTPSQSLSSSSSTSSSTQITSATTSPPSSSLKTPEDSHHRSSSPSSSSSSFSSPSSSSTYSSDLPSSSSHSPSFMKPVAESEYLACPSYLRSQVSLEMLNGTIANINLHFQQQLGGVTNQPPDEDLQFSESDLRDRWSLGVKSKAVILFLIQLKRIRSEHKGGATCYVVVVVVPS
ncbi:Non-specific serine/threonine protein kinase, variant 2 [Balamuthia mandrillaris]